MTPSLLFCPFPCPDATAVKGCISGRRELVHLGVCGPRRLLNPAVCSQCKSPHGSRAACLPEAVGLAQFGVGKEPLLRQLGSGEICVCLGLPRDKRRNNRKVGWPGPRVQVYGASILLSKGAGPCDCGGCRLLLACSVFRGAELSTGQRCHCGRAPGGPWQPDLSVLLTTEPVGGLEE